MGKSPCLMGQSPCLMGKSSCLMGKSPCLMGKSPCLMGKSPCLTGKSPFLMGKSTISIAIFNSYFDITRVDARAIIVVKIWGPIGAPARSEAYLERDDVTGGTAMGGMAPDSWWGFEIVDFPIKNGDFPIKKSVWIIKNMEKHGKVTMKKKAEWTIKMGWDMYQNVSNMGGTQVLKPGAHCEYFMDTLRKTINVSPSPSYCGVPCPVRFFFGRPVGKTMVPSGNLTKLLKMASYSGFSH